MSFTFFTAPNMLTQVILTDILIIIIICGFSYMHLGYNYWYLGLIYLLVIVSKIIWYFMSNDSNTQIPNFLSFYWNNPIISTIHLRPSEPRWWPRAIFVIKIFFIYFIYSIIKQLNHNLQKNKLKMSLKESLKRNINKE